MVRFSLRLKVLLLISVVTASTLAALLAVAVRIFTSDKVADIRSTGVSLVQSLATQGRIELESVINSLRPVMAGYRPEEGRLSQEALYVLKQISVIQQFRVYKWNGATYDIAQEEPTTAAEALRLPVIDNPTLLSMSAEGIAVRGLGNPTQPLLLLSVRFGPRENPSHTMVLASLQGLRFLESVRSRSNYAIALLGQGASLITQNPRAEEGELPPFSEWETLPEMIRTKSPPGTADINNVTDDTLLLSQAPVGIGSLTVAAYVPKKQAMQAVSSFVKKAVAVFIILILLAFGIASLASGKITATLSSLTTASQKVALGEFNLQLQVESNDEIGVLARSFTTMAERLKYYVQEVAQKAQLETELNTARTVQETLFPPTEVREGDVEISGFYEPAGQCGGDWWHYCRVGTKVFFWIGDATGHGVPAALLTSAARSAAAVIELFPQVTPGQALQILNRAIHETSRGKLLMTFFVGCYDSATKKLTYANASHEPPILVHAAQDPITKKQLSFLNDVSGPRLGETLTAKFKEASLDIQLGDRIFFYTDGLSDLKDPAGNPWGERKFLKAIVQSFNAGGGATDCKSFMASEMLSYRQDAKLDDDVTYFCAKIGDAA